MNQPIVSLKNLQVSATTDAGRRVEIIKGISFDIPPGEILALIGESGSGKTTVALALMGYTRSGCQINQGEILLDGHDLAQMTDRECDTYRGALMSYIPQSAAAAFNPSKRLIEQVIEAAKIHDVMPADAAHKKAIELFHALALPDPDAIGDRYPHQVSGGQLQRLAAAMALITDPRLVIFDEPTTALDVTTQIEVLRAFKLVMKKSGTTGVYVTHDLAIVAQIADRIAVLKDGEMMEIGDTESILHAPQHPYTKELMSAFEPVVYDNKTSEDAEAQTPIVEVKSVYAGYGAKQPNGLPSALVLKDINFSLMPGKNMGVIGESGSGKSTLARVLAGLLSQACGDVSFCGNPLAGDLKQRTKDELRRIQIVFQLADTALNPNKSISDILGRPLQFYHGLRGGEKTARVDELLDMVHLSKAIKHRLPSELSGGQKQRINLARALAADPQLILCDEVTSALDTVVAAAILDLLKELQENLSLSYLFISHDLSTVETICDDVLVMYKGEIVEHIATSQMRGQAQHDYTRLLISSVPKLDTKWLEDLEQDPAILARFSHA
ncbi:ABC transporter ATP-binding protein [uncultured Ruegeria sp.]|uniref:ABC transporter ATP-binding protein n=1 Tax=uncultured Ruegeria sp. TaxID=259304 RepID=UPI0026378E87|nr:ABC transporter ATP-binding protein [uncultured Ruegeria sp.]